MFDFTQDMSDFLECITDWINYFLSVLNVLKSDTSTIFQQLSALTAGLPDGIRQVILATLSVWLFFLFRNGKGG